MNLRRKRIKEKTEMRETEEKEETKRKQKKWKTKEARGYKRMNMRRKSIKMEKTDNYERKRGSETGN